MAIRRKTLVTMAKRFMTQVNLVHVAFGIVILFLGHTVGMFISSVVTGLLDTSKSNSGKRGASIALLGKVIYTFVIAMSLLVVLQLFGLQTTSIVALLSTFGIAAGLGLQGTLTDFTAGLVMMATNRFDIGDVIQLEGSDVLGKV